MTLVGVKIDNSVTRQSGPYYFKIQGELYHLTGALLSHGDQTPIYAQIYILCQGTLHTQGKGTKKLVDRS